MENFTKTIKRIDINSPHFEQESWSTLLNMCDASITLIKQQQKQILQLNKELKDLKK